MRFPRSFAAGLLAGVLGAALFTAATAPAASADTAPKAPTTLTTVSADALPTVQVNGVVWSQVIVGTTVYATGAFTSARPAGSAAGSNETARSNLLAYNLTTGALVTTWAPTLNAQGLAIAASPDGTKIYVGGDFTTVSGVARNRIVALNATTGAVITGFTASLNSRVRALVATADTVYAGGAFTTAGGVARSRLAAFNPTTGALSTAWNPGASAEVFALTVPPGSHEVVAGGRFTTLGGAAAIGMGAVDAATGASLPWVVNQTVQNYGSDAAIYSLSSDATRVYGTGYGYLVTGNPDTNANLENSFAATVDGGALVWANGCLGDTYDGVPIGSVFYTVGHAHNCSAIGGHPQTDPWTYQRALATSAAAGTGLVNQGGAFNGQPAPELLHWLPTLGVGDYTKQYQGAWTITGNSNYVVLGGEFPTVNGTAQQGLVRFAVSSIATNKQGPQTATTLTPGATTLAAGRVRVSWQATWDRDNRNLTYEVLRGTSLATAKSLVTLTQDSSWWSRPNLAYYDTTATPGSTYSYWIRVKDAFGNTVTSAAKSYTVPTGTPAPGTYPTTVLADGATHLWRLGEDSGTTAYDWSGADDLVLDASATRGADGALGNEATARSTSFPGSASVPAADPTPTAGPQAFSEELWFKTTTGGGKLIGFGDSATGTSNNYDRQIYLTDSGNVVFGVYSGGVRTLTSPLSYTDGQWHHVVAGLGASGTELWIDGRRIGRDAGTTSAQPFTGYWRIAGDNLGGWPNQPGNQNFTGQLQDVAVYAAPLTTAQIQAHYQAGGRSLNLPAKPTDAYGAAVWAAEPTQYWRLDETSGTTATDRLTNTPGATYAGGVTLGTSPSPAWADGTAVTLTDGTVVAAQATDNPTVYSEAVWFRTTTTDGGRIIGFGNAATGTSDSYDRHVYMLNDGRLRYGIWTGSAATIDSTQSYNDGSWHFLVATLGGSGMQLFVDGQQVGTNPANNPQGYTGYWRLGADNTWGGNNSNAFAGSLDEAAIFDSVLPDRTIASLYALGAPAPANAKPTAAFTSAVDHLNVAFDGSGSSDPDGTVASYAWDFGDGTTGSGSNPAHAYAAAGSYDVKLTVKDNAGATDTVTHTVTATAPANVSPTAAFTSTCTTLACSFDASASADPDGSIAGYAWNFGDGGTSSAASPAHTFAQAGTYPVKLTVTDNRGGTGTITQSVTVAKANAAPTAAFTPTCTNLACSFDGSASADADGSIAGYAWDFGDGSTSTATRPSHTFASAGTVTVKLTVTDNTGATGTTSQAVTVSRPANVLPTAAFTSSCTNLACSFDGSGSADPDGSIAGWAWDFGDGAKSTSAKPAHTFASAGTYAVALTVIDDRGGVNTVTQNVTVATANQAPTAAFTPTCGNLACEFNATASADPDGSIVAALWNFGDGSTSTAANPTHTYASAGTYTVSLTVTDDRGATGTASSVVTVTAASSVLAADTFGRTTANGFGTAETGGAWSITGAGTNFAVAGGVGTQKLATAGLGIGASLNGVSAAGTDSVVTVSPDKVVSGNGAYVWVTGRKTSGGEYRARVRLLSSGGVAVQVSKYVSGTETAIGSESTVAGLTYAAGTQLRIRFQVEGSGTTTLRLRVWKAADTEPSVWSKTGTDTTAALQTAGAVGLNTYLSGSSTSAPVTIGFDDYRVTRL